MFCVLEKDGKTYNYMQQVLQYIRENRIDSLARLDNFIQKGEIKEHLRLNGFHEDDRLEAVNWVNRYACSFREYLNTIKVAALLWSVSHKHDELTWDAFCALADELNAKKTCLDAIHK